MLNFLRAFHAALKDIIVNETTESNLPNAIYRGTYITLNGVILKSLWQRFEEIVQSIRASFELTPDMADDLVDFGATIAQQLTHSWEDCGVGGYEFWGQRGTHTDWRPFVDEVSIYVKIHPDVKSIPMSVEHMYEHAGGGCDDENPNHRCSRECSPVSIPFCAQLVGLVHELGSVLAEYSIENKNN